jgi:hypothetical protein
MTSRHGKRWTEDEVNILHYEFASGKTVNQMAISIGRTDYAIINKLHKEVLISSDEFRLLFNVLYKQELDNESDYSEEEVVEEVVEGDAVDEVVEDVGDVEDDAVEDDAVDEVVEDVGDVEDVEDDAVDEVVDEVVTTYSKLTLFYPIILDYLYLGYKFVLGWFHLNKN